MLDKGVCVRFYKRKDIQDAIIAHAKNKEIGFRYIDAFGKRPDILTYPKEILELSLRGVTSFHASEELWENPLDLESSKSKKELDQLRSGWDLVLDIDCIDWEFSKLTTCLFIKALKENGVKDISCKFSGNKGFHIGVPFEAFPAHIAGQKTKDLFPIAAQKISQYLLDVITKRYLIKDNKIFFDEKYVYTLDELNNKFGKREFIINSCSSCKKKIHFENDAVFEFICPKCEKREKEQKNFIKCDKCGILMEKIENKKSLCPCGSDEYNSNFNPESILEIDTVLISSRHLYRMPYSLHEKSGLVSLPIDPEKVMEFQKEMAKPDGILMPMFTFLDRNVSSESARQLLLQALDFDVKLEEEKEPLKKEYDELTLTSPIREEFFPPCMKLLLQGISDGKKRGVFILMNYLGKIGWNKEEIEAYLHSWNTKNDPEPLREVYIKGQLHSFKAGERLPPNCNNEAYYRGIGICKPDSFCPRIKNPVNYTILKWKRHLQDKEEEAEGKKGKKQRQKKSQEIVV